MTSEELRPGLSEARQALLHDIANTQIAYGSRELDVFAPLVIQQMDHLLARVKHQDALLVRLEAALKRHEAAHVAKQHPTPVDASQAAWRDGVARQHDKTLE